MSSSKIEALKKQREISAKTKTSQLPYALAATGIVVVIYLVLLNYRLDFSSYWLIGILIGITLQRSRFCFAASFRDPILVGSTSILKAIILAFIVSTIGFFIVQYRTILLNPDYVVAELPGQLNPVGIHTAIGALVFGTGMVIAGGCASGVLVRIGEGYLMQVVVLIGFIIGVTLGASHFPFWDNLLISKTSIIYFPEYIGLIPALITQLIVLCCLYFAADWYDKKNSIMTK